MQITNNNVEAAINWIVEHGDELQEDPSSRHASVSSQDFVIVRDEMKMVARCGFLLLSVFLTEPFPSLRQVLLVRTDLDMSAGKIAAQVDSTPRAYLSRISSPTSWHR